MASYTAKAKNTSNFTLYAKEKELGKLKYEKWFSFKAILTLADHTFYPIEPKGFWGTTIELKKNEKVLLNFKMNWQGNIIIHTQFDDQVRDFVFKNKSLFKGTYVLTNQQEQELLIIQPDFKWNQLNYDYNITSTESFEEFSFKDILLLTVLHCANYYMTMMTSAT